MIFFVKHGEDIDEIEFDEKLTLRQTELIAKDLLMETGGECVVINSDGDIVFETEE